MNNKTEPEPRTELPATKEEREAIKAALKDGSKSGIQVSEWIDEHSDLLVDHDRIYWLLDKALAAGEIEKTGGSRWRLPRPEYTPSADHPATLAAAVPKSTVQKVQGHAKAILSQRKTTQDYFEKSETETVERTKTTKVTKQVTIEQALEERRPDQFIPASCKAEQEFLAACLAYHGDSGVATEFSDADYDQYACTTLPELATEVWTHRQSKKAVDEVLFDWLSRNQQVIGEIPKSSLVDLWNSVHVLLLNTIRTGRLSKEWLALAPEKRLPKSADEALKLLSA